MVVEKGKGDGLFINTTGIGLIEHSDSISPASVRMGDHILLSGDLGRHGMAILAQREGLGLDTLLHSDSAPLADLILHLLEEGIEIHCLRDLTRGGLATALNEIASAVQLSFVLEEAQIPVAQEVQGICEILGMDPLYVANEGRFVAFVAAKDVDPALTLMRTHPQGQGAQWIGSVTASEVGRVSLKNTLGSTRVLDLLSGEQLPRIC
jgi:hydrogenase expression/formation protein HypE